MNMNERLTDEEIDELARLLPQQPWGTGSRRPDAREFARAIESAVLARAAVPAVQPQEPVAFIDLDTGEHLDERGEPLKPADTVFDRWYATQAHQLSNEQVCRVIWRAGWNAGVAAAFGMEPLYAAPQAEARQEQPKQPDSVYSAQPSGEAATARDAARYRWLRDADQSDAALPYSELLLFAGKSLDAAIDAALSSTPAQGDGGTGGVGGLDERKGGGE
jgi:hypothetical protein